MALVVKKDLAQRGPQQGSLACADWARRGILARRIRVYATGLPHNTLGRIDATQ